MPHAKKATDQELINAYNQLGSVWKVAEQFGMCGQTVHGRLRPLGALVPKNSFGSKDDKRLKREYLDYRNRGRLQDLADEMGRTKHFLCRQARRLGLTDTSHLKPYSAVWKYISEAEARPIFEKFKAAPMGLGAFCQAHGYDDLGFTRLMKKHYPDEWEHVMEAKVPKTTMYRRGRQFEYRIRDYLKSLGYFVMRSPASRSPIDLVAIAQGEVLFVQCKLTDALPPAEWNALFDLAVSVSAVPVLATRSKPRKREFWRLVAKKDGSKKPQPRERFVPKNFTKKEGD